MNDIDTIKLKRNLTALVDFSRVLNSSLDINFILNNILLTCMGKFLTSKGFIALKVDGNLVLKTYKGISNYQSFPLLKADSNFDEKPEFNSFLNSNSISIVEKIHSSNNCLGILCLGERLNKSPYTEEDKEFLRTILNISATAIQNALVLLELTKVNRTLDSRVHSLKSLFELSKELGILSDSKKVAKVLSYSIIGQFLISKYAVINFDAKKGIRILESKFPVGKLKEVFTTYNLFNISEPIKKCTIKDEFTLASDLGVNLIIPMQWQNETKGLILLGERMLNAEYTDSEIEYISSAGSLAIISLENRKLFKETIEKQKMEEELEIARDIQKNLLPKEIKPNSVVDIAALNVSSKQVGGDYFDVIPFDDNNFCFVIADVSGKGVPAALMMANLQAFLKTISKNDMDLVEATGYINDLVTGNTSDGRFITFFWGTINCKTKELTYVNAGHNPPLLIRNNEIKKMEKGGMILGVMNTMVPYMSEKIQLESNDLIVLFTDGVTEAKNRNFDEYSDERLEELSVKIADFSAEDIMHKIKDDVTKFSSGTHQSDDITLMVLKVR